MISQAQRKLAMAGPGSVGHCPSVDPTRRRSSSRRRCARADIHEEPGTCATGIARSVDADGLEREDFLVHDLHLSGYLHLYLFTGVFA